MNFVYITAPTVLEECSTICMAGVLKMFSLI
jgi:hypothetical protein